MTRKFAIRRRTNSRLGPHFAVVRIERSESYTGRTRTRTETLSEHMTLKSATATLRRWENGR